MKIGLYSFFILILSVFLSACDKTDKMANLQKFMAEQRAQPDLKLPHLPQFKTYSAYEYSRSAISSPFQVPAALLSYPLKNLQLVGIIQTGQDGLAFIKTPTHKVYRVLVGDYLGTQQGQIQTISAYSITVAQRNEQGIREDIIIPLGDYKL